MDKPLYKRRGFVIAAIVVAIPVIAVAWYLGSPLFIDKTVIEDFPQAAGTGEAGSPDTTQTAPTVTATTVASDPGTSTDGSTTTSTEATTTEVPASTTPGGEPSVLASGSFVDGEPGHHGEGSATIYELEDGSRVLRFEGLDVTNGPDLHVILTSVPEPGTREDVMAVGYVDLGGLKGNKGDQNYDIPDDFDVSQAAAVVIYCQPFHVIFSTATLTVP